MGRHKIRVGIVGLRSNQGWAAVAHVPALRHLSESFEIAGIANSTIDSATTAAIAHGIPKAFASAAELISSPDIDLVVVTTRVPQHHPIVRTAISAGKQIFCEWPLGRTLTEAIELTDLARSQGVLAVTGTQSRVSPAIRKVQRLLAEGYIGEVVSTCTTGYVKTWGPTIADVAEERYLRERSNGASLLTIPLGHTLAALRDVLGDVAEVSAILETRYPHVRVAESDMFISADAPDHIVVAGRLANDAPLAIFYAGGAPAGDHGFTWDIRGTDGDLRITGPHGYSQIAELSIAARNRTGQSLTELPTEPDPLQSLGLVVGNVARIYQRIASDLNHGTQKAPTFEDGVALHRVLLAIEQADESRACVEVHAPNRSLP